MALFRRCAKDVNFDAPTCSLRLDRAGSARYTCVPDSLTSYFCKGRCSPMKHMLRKLWFDDRGQDIAEYAVILAVVLVLVVGTVTLVGSNANNVFSSVASSIQ